MFETEDFAGCCDKIAAHGITVTKEEFALINEVIVTGSDDALIEEITETRNVESSLAVLHKHGYNAMTADFLLLVRDSTEHLCKELLTQEEIRELSGDSFYGRCRKSINMIFALGTIAGLVMGVSSLTDRQDAQVCHGAAHGLCICSSASARGSAVRRIPIRKREPRTSAQ